MLAIGLMSGTSLDGIDACLVKITKYKGKYQYHEKNFIFIPYEDKVKEKIMEASLLSSSNVQKICSLNFELGYLYKNAVEKLLELSKITIEDITFIAMHGQTIWHNIEQMDGYFSSTLQIGEPSVLAYHFNKLVISNFRVMDIVAGGLGAPLVPYVNYLLYQNRSTNVALQNIGGIGNVTFIPPFSKAKDVIAFDTGPGNMLIDEAMKILYQLPYDEKGQIALKGIINNEVLALLMDDEYLKKPYPKSTGREKYNRAFLNKVLTLLKDEPKENIIATLSAYTADSIVKAYIDNLPPLDEVIISGGGAHNDFIVNRIKAKLKCKVKIEDRLDSYEAFCFAVLGHQTYLHEPSNLTVVTKAKEEVVLGNFTYPPRKKK